MAGNAVFAGSPRAFFARIASSSQPFLSHCEEFLWWSARLAGDTTFNVRVVLRLRGALHRAALEASIVEIARRHETLRTVFPMENGVVLRRLLPPDAARPAFVDLQPMDPAARDAEAWRLVLEESNKSFNLGRGPLFRSTILQVAPDTHLLQFTIHHLVVDGRSVDILLRELGALYGAYTEDRESPLPELPVQYAAHAARRKRMLSGAALDRTLAYWRAQLAGIPSLLPLPTDAIRRTARHYPGHTLTFALDAGRTAAIQATARRHGTTLFVFLLSVLKLLLYRLSGSSSIAIETPLGNRRSLEAEALIGLLVDLVPLRTDLAGNLTFAELLSSVRRTTLGAFDHAGVPIHALVSAVDVDVDPSHSAVCQVMFNLINRQQRVVHLASLQAEQLPLPDSPHSKFDMMLTAHLTDALGFQLLYRRELFSEPRMQAFIAQYEALVDQALAAPDARIEQYSLVTAGCREPAVGGGEPAVGARQPAGGGRQGAAGRRRSALGDGDSADSRLPTADCRVPDEVSHGDLDDYSDQVAHRLAASGFRPGDVAPVRHGSALSLAGGLLGAIKAGASDVLIEADEGARVRFSVPALVDCGRWTSEALSIGPGSRAGVLPGADDNALALAVVTAFHSGAPLCVPPRRKTTARDLDAWMDQEIAVAFGEPAAWRRLRKNGGRLASLRGAVFAGGVLVQEDVRRVRALAPGVACWYVCGFDGLAYPSSAYWIPPDGRDIRTIVPIGRGLPRVELVILTRDGGLAGVGELGEIHVRDNRQRAAGEPFTATGLLGRFLPDGDVDRVGGAFDWGSVDGYTIRFDEIASALMRHPDILDARVAIESNCSGAQLVSYLACDDERPWPGDLLDAFVRDHVPGFMVPRRFARIPGR